MESSRQPKKAGKTGDEADVLVVLIYYLVFGWAFHRWISWHTGHRPSLNLASI